MPTKRQWEHWTAEELDKEMQVSVEMDFSDTAGQHGPKREAPVIQEQLTEHKGRKMVQCKVLSPCAKIWDQGRQQ